MLKQYVLKGDAMSKYKCSKCGFVFKLNYYQEGRIKRRAYITYNPIIISNHLIFGRTKNGGVRALCPYQFNGGEK